MASRLNLRFHSEKAAINATNKYSMRVHAKRHGISIPRFELAATLDDALMAAKQIGFPAIMKPTDNCSSRGVFVVVDESELENSFKESLENSFEKRVSIEQLLYGTEGSAEAIVVAKNLHILGICSKKKSELPFRFDLQLDYPGAYTDVQFEKIHELLSRIVTAYDIQEGIIHVEFIAQGPSVSLIEFALRGCGVHLGPFKCVRRCALCVVRNANTLNARRSTRNAN